MAKTRYETGRQAPFVQLPISLITDPDVDPHTLTTYAVIKSYCHFGSGVGAYPSDEQAAKRAGMSRRTFIDRRTLLRDKGWLEWNPGQGTTNSYIVHGTLDETPDSVTQTSEGVQEAHRGCAGDAQGGVQEMHTTYIQVTKIKIPKSREADFARFLEEVDELWGFWETWRAKALERNRVPQKATWKRVRPILDRLDEGYQLADLKEAVLGCCHRKHNVEGGYLDIELICRDQSHVDMYVQHWRQVRGSRTTSTVEQTKMTIGAMYG